MNLYKILVDNEELVTDVKECDLQHKVELIREYCKILPENRRSRVTYEVINNTETIA